MGAAGLGGTETVLEIGAGVGALTWILAESARQVVAVELDRRLWSALVEATKGLAGIKLVHGDILELPLEGLIAAEPYVVVANIPYNITSVLIRKLLVNDHSPERIVLTVQKEVAERIVAEPGDMGLLSLSVQAFGTPRVCGKIAASHFHPPPKVGSAILRIDPHPTPLAPGPQLDRLFSLARAGFGQRRKQLVNSLAGGLKASKAEVRGWLNAADLDPKRRAQSLALAEWIRLARASLAADGKA